MDKYIKMFVYKLGDKIKYSSVYRIKYKGQWENYYNKRDVVKRLAQIDKEE